MHCTKWCVGTLTARENVFRRRARLNEMMCQHRRRRAKACGGSVGVYKQVMLRWAPVNLHFGGIRAATNDMLAP